MGHFPQDGESGQNVDFFIFWSSAVTKWFDFFSTFLNRSEEILTAAFQKCFRFGPSSSRTRARAI